MRLKPYLQLIRLPNLFTSGADSLAGWLIGGGALAAWPQWLPVVLASMVLYAAGIALNDVFDLDLDRAERPFRPIPSGAVGVRFATGLSVLGFVAGLGLVAWTGSLAALAVAAALILAVLGYDAGLRRTAAGPVVMGLCRALNLGLGLTLAQGRLQAPLDWPFWLIPAGYGLFVMGLTIASRSETHTGQTDLVRLGLAVENASLGLLAALALGLTLLPGRIAQTDPYGPGRGLDALMGLIALGLVALAVNRAGARALSQPEPATIQRLVKTSVLSLVWIDVALTAAARGPLLALAVAALWVPAYGIARWLYAT